MVEVDDGDNEERAEVTSVLHEFDFTARGVKEEALLTWDFGDGATATGMAVTHAFEHPGIYTVRVTSISLLGVETSSIGIEVDLQGEVESDNMECTCAPHREIHIDRSASDRCACDAHGGGPCGA